MWTVGLSVEIQSYFFYKKFPRAKCGRATVLKLAHERKDFHRSVSGGSRSYDMKEVSGIVTLK